MATGETIKGLFSQEMSSIPHGWRRRRRRRGAEEEEEGGLEKTELSGDLPDNVLSRRTCVDSAAAALMAAPKPGEFVRLIKCNNR